MVWMMAITVTTCTAWYLLHGVFVVGFPQVHGND